MNCAYKLVLLDLIALVKIHIAEKFVTESFIDLVGLHEKSFVYYGVFRKGGKLFLDVEDLALVKSVVKGA